MPTAPPQVGTDFGDYHIEAVLGRGAMGVVYRARQRRLDRAVALKVLPTDLTDDPDYRRRFAREAAALARLDSPHVVQIHDHGDLDGHPDDGTRTADVPRSDPRPRGRAPATRAGRLPDSPR